MYKEFLKNTKKILITPIKLVYWFFLNKKINLSTDEWGIICPAGLGDTYFICALLEEFLLKNKGGKVVIVVKDSHKAIPEMFKKYIHRIVTINKIRNSLLPSFVSIKIGSFFVGHPSFFKNGGSIDFIGYKDIDLIDTYKLMLNLSPTAQLVKPVRQTKYYAEAVKIFKKYNLKKRKTVILSPSANSSDTLNVFFWEQLAFRLQKMNLQVLTNTNNIIDHIKNTIPLVVPLEYIFPIAEMSGTIISSRSGLCDVLSSADCKLIVIYKEQKWYNGTLFSGSSLKKLNLSDAAIEYQYREDNSTETLIDEIIKNLI